MSDLTIAFSEKSDKIESFLQEQNIVLPPDIFNELLVFLSRACIYEEEERKIRPSLIIGHNLLDKEFAQITQATMITFLAEPIEKSHLVKRLKSFLPFCNNGWRVFIDIGDKIITWGITRNFNGPSGLEYSEIISCITEEEKRTLKTYFVLIDIVSNYAIKLSGNNQICTIDFRLTKDYCVNNENQEKFCTDLLSAVITGKNRIYNAYLKILNLFSQKLHGSICLVIQHDYTIPDETLKDGIFLKEPIDIYSILADELNDDNSVHEINSIISSHQKYHALTGILLEMLNIDGITVVDNMGRIRAFNVFVKPDSEGFDELSGGARKRAAEYLKRQKNRNYIGVYFQSQDGMISYERNDNYE